MKNFEGYGLSDKLYASLDKMGFKVPTPIQDATISLAIDGRDVLGSAQTGTGKTGAFSIPLVEKLLRSDRGTALVLTPTRELAKQVMDVIVQLTGRDSGLRTAFIIGGEPMGKQLNQLKSHPRIIVGTPGRVNDHLRRGTLKLGECGFLVLDETDRMLDMGFGVQLDEIVKYLPQTRQTLMFSATLPHGIVALSKKYLHNPERISMGATNVIAPKIKQETVRIHQDDKYGRLIDELNERQGSVIIFVKTKYGTEKMAKSLCRDGFEADALHGDLRQNKRTNVMKSFRDMKFRVLVATDIAARGLDVPHIEHVINFDLPQVAEDYIHRMGRTARAGADGSALSFVSGQDGRKWREIEKLLGIESEEPKRREKSNGGKSGKGKPQRKTFKSGKPRFNDNEPNTDRTEKRPFKSGKPRFAKTKGDTPREERSSRSDKPWASDKPKSGRSDRPQGNKKRSDKPHAGKKPFAGKPSKNGNATPKSFGDKSRARPGKASNFRKAG